MSMYIVMRLQSENRGLSRGQEQLVTAIIYELYTL